MIVTNYEVRTKNPQKIKEQVYVCTWYTIFSTFTHNVYVLWLTRNSENSILIRTAALDRIDLLIARTTVTVTSHRTFIPQPEILCSTTAQAMSGSFVSCLNLDESSVAKRMLNRSTSPFLAHVFAVGSNVLNFVCPLVVTL